MPFGVPFGKAEEVALSKAGWIKKHMDKMAQFEKEARALAKHNHINRVEAKERLVNRLDDLSQIHGFTYNRVFIRNQKTRWGSCSGENNINLNVNLVRLPDELIDYTILHELVHTRVKDHSKQFWDELDKFVGNAKNLDKKLNNYKILLL